MKQKKTLTTPDALQIKLHGETIAICVKLTDGRNQLVFNPDYINTPALQRPTFTLMQIQNPEYLQKTAGHHQRLSPVLSNLLPEGALRTWYASQLKIHENDEFALLAATGRNLAGAITAEPINTPLPDWSTLKGISIKPIDTERQTAELHFSLSGVQMKFSGTHKDGRYTIGDNLDGEQWIVKTPSTIHPHVPANEYSAMKLAESVGIDIPEIRLVPMTDLDNLPRLQLPEETMAFAIRRFDRDENGTPIHTEDFAQIFNLYPHDKYTRINYEQIGRILLQYSSQSITDITAMAKRLLANILLANGDAHIKNWSLIYPDRISPRLAPAYDIVSTLPYIATDKGPALNMAKEKNWQRLSLAHFKHWAERINAPWHPIQEQLIDTLRHAHRDWHQLLETLPMADHHKNILRTHWQSLHQDFRF